MFHAYVLYSPSLDKYYIGSCGEDLDGRLRRHLSGHKGFTGRAKDWQFVHVEKFGSKAGATARERQIKGWKSRKMLEKLIQPSD
ncbi:MAG: GIY-YIG nuclease family protein [Lewinellaceae bacterium]|nr:GIY-YIG nuclease family protein [Lewinellaceae bacterium]